MQAYEGYLENGTFFPIGKAPPMPRMKVRLTVVEEPAKKVIESREAMWEEFKELLEQSSHEELRMEDFPRMDLGRELIIFDDDDMEG